MQKQNNQDVRNAVPPSTAAAIRSAGVCGERLPKELLFSPEQRKIIEKELDKSKQGTPFPSDSGGDYFGISSTDMGSI